MANLLERRGNIFTSTCDAIAITVNCQGVMGAGIALEARLRWPKMFEAYREVCENEELRPGGVYWWPSGGTKASVACVATKGSWRFPSQLGWVKKCLEGLAEGHESHDVGSIALPRLGTSHGGLDWEAVRPWVFRILEPTRLDVEVWDFDPRAEDPWFEELRAFLRDRTASDVSREFGISRAAAQKVSDLVASPHVRSLLDLQGAKGVGEKTIAAVYRHLFEGGARQEMIEWD